jgi:hypothetical protein
MIKSLNSKNSKNNCDDCDCGCKEDLSMGTSCSRQKFPDIGELSY